MQSPEIKVLRWVARIAGGFLVYVLGHGVCWMIVSLVDLDKRVTVLEHYAPIPHHALMLETKKPYLTAFGFDVPPLIERKKQ